MSRSNWDKYFMDMVEVVRSRATCDRLSVGAVIVRDNNVISTGYNGSPKGEEHCSEEGCYMKDGSCVRTIHAEMNAIMNAMRNGVDLTGSKMYVSHYPCYNCAKHIVQSGVSEVVYLEDYRNGEDTAELFSNSSVDIKMYDEEFIQRMRKEREERDRQRLMQIEGKSTEDILEEDGTETFEEVFSDVIERLQKEVSEDKEGGEGNNYGGEGISGEESSYWENDKEYLVDGLVDLQLDGGNFEEDYSYEEDYDEELDEGYDELDEDYDELDEDYEEEYEKDLDEDEIVKVLEMLSEDIVERITGKIQDIVDTVSSGETIEGLPREFYKASGQRQLGAKYVEVGEDYEIETDEGIVRYNNDNGEPLVLIRVVEQDYDVTIVVLVSVLQSIPNEVGLSVEFEELSVDVTNEEINDILEGLGKRL